MLRALIPGSFDPPTYGHLNIIRRAARIFDSVNVVVADNFKKRYTFTARERAVMLSELTDEIENVNVTIWSTLITSLAEQCGAEVLVRGVRALEDFPSEFELAVTNMGLYPQIETVFFPAEPEYFVTRSSSIKEFVRLGSDVSSMVPPIVEKNLQKKLASMEEVFQCES